MKHDDYDDDDDGNGQIVERQIDIVCIRFNDTYKKYDQPIKQTKH